jgi:ParB family chromosome partitioning protein
MQIIELPLNEIFSDPTFNCRGDAIAPIDVVDLVRDIEAHGLQQPIVVQPFTEYRDYIYRIICGHRRFAAFKILSRVYIPCIINKELTEAEALILNLGENLHRKDLNILQEARTLERLKMAGMGISEVAEQLGKSTTWVNVRYQLLELPEQIKNAAASGFINQAQIRQIHKLPDIQKQMEAAKKIKDAKARGDKKMPRINAKSASKRNILKPKIRDRDDIFWMQDHMQESVGNNIGTRCLAWAAGEISDFELFQDIQEEAAKTERSYAIPYGLQNL